MVSQTKVNRRFDISPLVLIVSCGESRYYEKKGPDGALYSCNSDGVLKCAYCGTELNSKAYLVVRSPALFDLNLIPETDFLMRKVDYCRRCEKEPAGYVELLDSGTRLLN